MYLESISSPADVKKLSVEQMNVLAGEIREALLQKLSAHGVKGKGFAPAEEDKETWHRALQKRGENRCMAW